MKTFLFYAKDGKYTAVEQGSEDIALLESKNYQNLHIKIAANNKQEAINQYKKEQQGSQKELKDYAYSIAFCGLVGIIGTIAFLLR